MTAKGTGRRRGVAGILLTGGASRRLGPDRDKATLTLDGQTFANRAAATLGAVCHPCVEVGPGRSGLRSVTEVPPGSGPLSAFVAGWRALEIEFGHDGPVVVLAVDMPRITPELLRLVAEAAPDEGSGADATVVPEAGGRLQPLCARYSRDACVRAEELLDRGERSMHALLDRVAFRRLAEETWIRVATTDAFADVDTPEDWEALR